MEASIGSLSEVHDRLARWFEEHQLALIDRDVARAGQMLARFARGIRAHIRHEEDVLLPVYRERVEHGRMGDPATLIDEHRKIEEVLRGLERRMEGLDASTPAAVLLSLLEEHYRFKQTLEHHNEREDRTLYPLLDAACSPEERKRLLAAGEVEGP